MDIDLARSMVRAAFESGRPLQAILPRLKQGLEGDAYHACAHDIAVAIDKVNMALIARALSAYPELEVEVDAAIGKTGRY